MLDLQTKIRVLLVDDIPETRENLRRLLYFEKDIEVVGVARSGEEAIALTKELEPDIVLMDINMPEMDGIVATEAILSHLPTTQVIMMSVQGETDYLRRSMLVGAKGFLIKPFTSDEMVSTVRRVYELRPKLVPAPPLIERPVAPPPGTVQMPPPRRSDRGNIIAVFSPKGGVGCSTLAANLAIALRTLMEKKVALVDCNLRFGDIGVLLNLTSERTLADLTSKKDRMDSDLLEAILMPHMSGVQVLLAPSRPEESELLSADHVREALGILRSSFSFIIVDTSSALDEVELAILDMADKIILVVTPDIPAVKDARLFFEVTEALGYPEEKVSLVLNKADRQSAIGPDEISAGLKRPVLVSIAADTRAAYTAANQGIPCILNNRASPIAQGVAKLAQVLYAELQAVAQSAPAPVEEAKQTTGILSRLLRK